MPVGSRARCVVASRTVRFGDLLVAESGVVLLIQFFSKGAPVAPSVPRRDIGPYEG